MAETRQIGRLTIHFLGDDAARLGKSFDDSFSGSPSFRDAMAETIFTSAARWTTYEISQALRALDLTRTRNRSRARLENQLEATAILL